MVFDTPLGFTLVGIVVFLFAYTVYSKIIDRKVWSPDRSKPTPAHMYADGVEFFPVGRFVLYGFQWNSIAALGPIIGPGTAALAFGWLPAFLWILFAALLIGWVQDYSSIFLSVRKEGRSFGPLAYEMLGPTPRRLLLGFLLLYLLLIKAAFIFVVGTTMNAFPGSFWSLLVLVIAAMITGHLLFRMKMSVGPVTILAIVLQAIGIALGATILSAVPPPGTFVFTPPPPGVAPAANPYTYWLVPLVAILILGSLLPMPRLITPMNYIAYYSLIPAVLLLTIGALVSPATGVKIQVPEFRGWAEVVTVGPLWPALFVTIACGAISGWHSLVSTGITSKQVDVETDIRPVGAGAMITENLVGLSALAAWAAIPLLTIPGGASPGNFVLGATTLTSPLMGGEAATPFLRVFFANYMVGMAVTILTILGRFWRVTMAEVFGGTPLSILGNKYIASVLGFVFPIAFVLTGSWTNIWLYFGGTNQLLAGFALLIVGLFLFTQRKFHWYTTIPGIFMMATTLAAIFYQTTIFARALAGENLAGLGPGLLHVTQRIVQNTVGYGGVVAINAFSTVVGVAMFIIGLAMAIYFVRGFRKAAKVEIKA
ncbi:MAG: carbon starvation CstA family protein [Candidatus Caldarchaeum sp.]|nr:carbon starvation protein A [Candidatus Caldarchaeum sp.]MDW8062830.1 carbon starvation CstA family protein [Candidatus Caldarchaeum sp.]MDW8435428.1 carbon starvation CstA family protein [Candidatus Caldarchaeum sp.]